MEQAYPEGYGLTAIMGLTRPRVEALMQGHEVYLANLNAETQFVIAGRDEAMAEVAQLALRELAPVKPSGWRSACRRTARCWINPPLSWRKLLPAPA